MFLWSAYFDNIAYAILSHDYTIKHSMIKRTKKPTFKDLTSH